MVQAVSPMARPGWHVRAHGPGVRWGGQVAQVHREGAFVMGARESWTVVASRSSIEGGIGWFC
jgi:hypothetical protein